MVKLIFILSLIGVLIYLLYIGSRRGKRAQFSGCNGYIKRVVKFKENREYHFVLSTELSKGEVSVELRDRSGMSVLCLDSSVGKGSITPETKRRYDLVIRFESASGSYELDWL